MRAGNSVHRAQYHQVVDTPGLVLGEAELGSFCFKRHFHLDFHIGVVTQGIEKIGFHGRTERLGPGFISCMPSHEIHDGAGDEAGGRTHTLKTFRIDAALMQRMIADVVGHDREVLLRPSVVQDTGWWRQLAGLHTVLSSGAPTSSLARDEQLVLLVESMLKHSRGVGLTNVEGRLGSENWKRISDFCQANLQHKITLDELAGLCQLSRFQFLRRFSQTVGLTPHAWLLRLRLEKSCTLLSDRKSTVATVASQVGFYDQSHFNRAFKQAFNVAPSAY